MADLVAWLTAQLDADAATVGAVRPDPGLSPQEPIEFILAGQDITVPSTEAAKRHIREFADPARVLREIEAKRKLLADYTTTVRLRDEAATRIEAAGDHPDPRDLDEWSRAHREAAILEGAVRLLALPFSHRPGYAEAVASVE